MQTFWVDIHGHDQTFWEHEWATHGTCMSTLDPSCLPSGSPPGAEAVAFFQTVVKLFQTLPTYDWLANQGITPSETDTYSLDTLTSALATEWGKTPALNCERGALNSVSYYFNLKGSIIDGKFVPIDAPSPGSCALSGITYPPKSGSSASSSPTGIGLPAQATTSSFPLKGTYGLLSSIFSYGSGVTASQFSAISYFWQRVAARVQWIHGIF
jgi:ribonuclease T2